MLQPIRLIGVLLEHAPIIAFLLPSFFGLLKKFWLLGMNDRLCGIDDLHRITGNGKFRALSGHSRAGLWSATIGPKTVVQPPVMLILQCWLSNGESH